MRLPLHAMQHVLHEAAMLVRLGVWHNAARVSPHLQHRLSLLLDGGHAGAANSVGVRQQHLR